MDVVKNKIKALYKQNALYKKIKSIWENASISYNKMTLWFGIIVPSLFINLLMLALPLAMLDAYDRVIPNSSTQTLAILIMIVILAAFFEMILRILRSMICSWSFARADYFKICKISDAILQAKINTLENAEKETLLTYSDLLSRTKQSRQEQVITTLLDLIFAAIFLLLIAYLGGILVMVPLGLMFILAWLMYTRDEKLKIFLKKQKDSEKRFVSSIIDSLSGIFTIKAMAMERPILRKFEFLELKKSEAIYDVNLTDMEINAAAALFSQFTFFLTVAVGAILVISQSMSVGGLAACTLLAGRGMQPIIKFINIWQKDDSSTEKIFINKVDSLPKEILNEHGLKKIITGKIDVNNIYIKNEKSTEYIFESVSLQVFPNETLCIMDDGSSSWAFFYVLMRFMLPEKGEVLLDEININNFNLNNLRQQICYLSKEAVLYNGTILENMTGFDQSKEALAREISLKIGLENVVSKFPQGYYTKVNPNAGQMFPRGMRQLISFIRMMINSPKIILLNNVTFGLNKKYLKLLIRAISLYQNNTTIVIATIEPDLFSLAKKHYVVRNKKLEESHHD